MRVLLTGAGGLLGGRLADILHRRGLDILALYRGSSPPAGPRAETVELLDGSALERVLDREQPDCVVHAAVLGRADVCESRPELARAVNADLPGRLAVLCRRRGIRLVALSTDLVFDGRRPPFSEATPPAPLSVYGRTKREGEQAVLDACPGAAVARVALVHGAGHGPRGTASESIAWALHAGRTVRLFTDEHRTPVDAESVAGGVLRLLESPATGLFHLGGPERLSRYELGRRVARALRLDASLLVPSVQADHAGPDPRPADVSLDSSRARRELRWEPRPLEAAVLDGRPAPP